VIIFGEFDYRNKKTWLKIISGCENKGIILSVLKQPAVKWVTNVVVWTSFVWISELDVAFFQTIMCIFNGLLRPFIVMLIGHWGSFLGLGKIFDPGYSQIYNNKMLILFKIGCCLDLLLLSFARSLIH